MTNVYIGKTKSKPLEDLSISIGIKRMKALQEICGNGSSKELSIFLST